MKKKMFANIFPYFLLPVKEIKGKIEKDKIRVWKLRKDRDTGEEKVIEEVFELEKGNIYPFLIFPFLLACFLLYTLFFLFKVSLTVGFACLVLSLFFFLISDFWLDAVLGFSDWKKAVVSYIGILFIIFLLLTTVFSSLPFVHSIVYSIVPISFQSTLLSMFVSFYLEIKDFYALKGSPYLVFIVKR